MSIDELFSEYESQTGYSSSYGYDDHTDRGSDYDDDYSCRNRHTDEGNDHDDDWYCRDTHTDDDWYDDHEDHDDYTDTQHEDTHDDYDDYSNPSIMGKVASFLQIKWMMRLPTSPGK